MTNELIAGYANYASTEAILHEQQNAALAPITITGPITIITIVTPTITITI
ncbi:hypothetical protein ACQP1K_10360 [Sphaerimonospora sp. CA-214678]|uniref:hypothetical protein n=1 Tax=Sphaerimonospora sp. CA-214678 TaxID=3240029 RepID=UPI003D90F75D